MPSETASFQVDKLAFRPIVVVTPFSQESAETLHRVAEIMFAPLGGLQNACAFYLFIRAHQT